MNAFSTNVVIPDTAPPDPTKHVNYNYGMVLGVADFSQEFAYLSARDQWMARDLIGYGTVSGLRVWVQPSAGGPRIVVEPGVAVTPRGELARVSLAQCASMNDWLRGDEQVKWLQQHRPAAPPTDRVDLYVTLCYRTCDTDRVPIPGGPCRDETEMTKPSRVMDDFRLELRFDPPEQPDEAAIRDFIDWLSHVPIVDGPSSVTLEQFLRVIRDAAFVASPPSPPDFMYGVPGGNLRIARSDACRYLRAAYRVWATELRPTWNASWWGAQSRCSDQRPAQPKRPEQCLLLAHLDVPLVRVALPAPGTWKVSDTIGIGVDEDARPFLVPLRLLQEILWCGGAGAAAAAGGTATAGATQIAAVGSVVIDARPGGRYNLQALVPRGAQPGEFKVTFDGYKDPTGAEFDYMVDATPKVSTLKNAWVEFLGFEADGIRLRLKDNLQPVPVANLPKQELMVQVTRFER